MGGGVFAHHAGGEDKNSATAEFHGIHLSFIEDDEV